MVSGNIIKNPKNQRLKISNLEYQVNNDIFFPKICIICGNNTEDQYQKIISGGFFANRDYDEDYVLNLPVCTICRKNINMKTGISSKSGTITLLSSIVGFILAIILYIFTLSLFLSISLFAVAFILPFVKYRKNIKKKVKLNDFLMIRLGKGKDTLIFEFLNENYAKYVDEFNIQKEKSEENPENLK